MDPYINLLLEAAHKASIVPMSQDTTFYAMKAFGTYDMTAPVVLSVIGGALGQLFNWYAGRTLIFFEYKGKFRITPQRYERVRGIAQKWAPVLLVFQAAIPFGNLLMVIAGFLKLPLKKTMPFVIAGLAAHYGMAAIR